jgi:predicted nucleotidyltransferase
MLPHHQATIEKLTKHFEADESVIALIIAGSLTKGFGKENSDVDFMLVVNDARYAQQKAAKQLTYFSRDFSAYEGGYVDGKFLNMQFLRDVNSHGSEVARSAFIGAFTTICRNPEVETLIKSILSYPEAEREAKIKSFYSQVLLWNWFVSEATKHNNRYLLLQAVTEIALFAGRLLLAHNRLLYPYHKWLNRQLENAAEKPADYFEKLDAMLENPSMETAQAFVDCVINYQDWGVTWEDAVQHFMHDRELNWREGKPTIHDW